MDDTWPGFFGTAQRQTEETLGSDRLIVWRCEEDIIGHWNVTVDNKTIHLMISFCGHRGTNLGQFSWPAVGVDGGCCNWTIIFIINKTINAAIRFPGHRFRNPCHTRCVFLPTWMDQLCIGIVN